MRRFSVRMNLHPSKRRGRHRDLDTFDLGHLRDERHQVQLRERLGHDLADLALIMSKIWSSVRPVICVTCWPTVGMM